MSGNFDAVLSDDKVENRSFDQLGPARPIQASFDLDGDSRWASIARISLGNCPEPRARLVLNESSGLRFVGTDPVSGAPSFDRAIELKAGPDDGALLVLERAVLEAAEKNGEVWVEINTKIDRYLTNRRPAGEDLRIKVRLCRTGPPRPVLEFNSPAIVDVAAPLAAESGGAIVLARLDIREQSSGIPPSGRARIAIDADATLVGFSQRQARLRVDRLRQNPDERLWQDIYGPHVEELEIDGEEGRLGLQGIDIGLPLTELRDFARNMTEPRLIELAVRISIETLDSPPIPIEQRDWLVVIRAVGAPIDKLLFNGLGMPMPMSTAIFSRPPEMEARYPLAPIEVRPSGRPGRYEAPERQLVIGYEGAGLLQIGVECALRIDNFIESEKRFAAQELSEGKLLRLPINVASLLRGSDWETEAGPAVCEVTVLVERNSESGREFDRLVFEIPLAIETGPVDWLVCVDFGASSTAIWIGRGGGDRLGLQLQLGEWLKNIDQFHDESNWWREEDGLTRPRPCYLLPSHIGLSDTVNLRADYDPLSLGDLSLSEPGEKGTLARLRHLGRSYDLSFPFPSRSEMAAHMDRIVTRMKRRMIGRTDYFKLNEKVAAFATGKDVLEYQQAVSLASLLSDCFHELGSYSTRCALSIEPDREDDRSSREANMRARLAAAIKTDLQDAKTRFGLVVTHPAGIDSVRRDCYFQAGKRFLEAFHNTDSLKGREPVRLVAEALAAARFGVQHFIENHEDKSFAGSARTFITLDIGAGTYDVTIIEADLTASGPTSWKVHGHFGLAIGGADLDRALAARIQRVLAKADATPEIAGIFEIETNLPSDATDLRHTLDADERSLGVRFLSEFQAAKARLTERLLGDASYEWRSRTDGGPPFDLRVGVPGSDPAWAVRLRDTGHVIPDSTYEIPGEHAEICVETVAGKKSFRLRLWPETFDRASFDQTRLPDLISLMAREIPRMAFSEYGRKCAPRAASAARPIWILTGRAALWPPLFGGIADTLHELGDAAGSLASDRPLAPDEMKRAVVEGAVQLAREPWANADNAVYNPVAAITFAMRTTAALEGPRVEQILRLVDANETEPPPHMFETSQSFVVARILPGLDEPDGRDERIALFHRLGIPAWEQLADEIAMPSLFEYETARWMITARRDIHGLHLTLDLVPQSPDRLPLIVGPLKERRVYASD